MNEPQPNTGTDASRSVLGTRYSVLARVFRLARKELREILRDRRTIVTLIAMPLLLYPLMSVVFLQFSLASLETKKSEAKYRVGLLTEAEAVALQMRLEAGKDALRRLAKKEGPKAATKVAFPEIVLTRDVTLAEPKTAEERAVQLELLKQSLHEGHLELIVVITNLEGADRLPGRNRALSGQMIMVSNATAGREVRNYIDTLLAAANEADLKARLQVPAKLPPITMLSLGHVTLEAERTDELLPLSSLVPLILILMTITGAVYPAIDLTAGERERGTLEILVAAPVPRFELLTAKYISVVTVAVLNAVVNLVCMTITVKWSGIKAPGLQELSIGVLLQVFALLLLFAAFFSAVLLCLTSFARSFKEAQAYLIPLMLASLGPGIMAMMPGLKLDHVLASLPLVNIVLMARDLFESGVDAVNGTIVVVTTLLYALAALSLAARVFGAESVLYSEQSSWSDLLRRPDEPQPSASIPAMLWCLALMVPVQFAMIALIRGLQPGPVAGVALQIVINLLLFGLLPAVFVYLGRVDLPRGLGMSMPRPAAWFGAVLLGVSLWPIELKLLEWMMDERTAFQQRLSAVLGNLREAREAIGWGLLAVAVVPAILEEAFFRGLLFQALKARSGALVTIAISGVLFGVTHVMLGGALGLERLAPSVLLGLILSAVCWHTGSLWPSMVLHVCHNAILIGVNPEDVPWSWVAAGSAGVVVGAVFVWQWGASVVRGP
jgi:ABC-2 type transport system permease protein/sodium transport system permease protein